MRKVAYKLEELCDIKSGKRLPANCDFSPVVTDFPYIRARDIKGGKISVDDLVYIEQDVQAKISKYIIETGDIAITIVGASVGDIGFADEVVHGYNLTENAVRLTQFNDKVYNKYLFYTLFQRQYRAYMQLIAGAAAQPKLGIYKIRNIRVELPDRDIQVKISSILSTYDDLIENNNRRIKILEQMAENLYKEWFVRFRFPGHEQAELENGMPKGWEYKTIEELSDTLRRGISPTYDSDGKYTVINQKCIRSSILDMSEAQQQSKPYKSELNLQDGDTVICSTGTGTLGRVGQVYGEYKDTTYDSHVTLVRANQVVGRHFLYWSLKELQPWFMNMGIGSTNQQELYRGTIKNAKILVPSNVDLLDAFENNIQDIHCQIGLLRDKNQNLTKQRDLLLPRLMSGKLEV